MGDAVAEACETLAGYFTRLEELVPDRAEIGIRSAGTRAYLGTSPYPGNAAAFRALMTAHEGVRRLLASARMVTVGYPGARFSGSDAHTAKVLALIPKAFAGLDDERRDAAVWFLNRWINAAKRVHGIDEAKRWRHLNRPRPGETMPPKCPYCQCFQLLADAETLTVACSVPDCVDSLGLPPVATMTIDGLEWADGKKEPVVDAGLDTAEPPGGILPEMTPVPA